VDTHEQGQLLPNRLLTQAKTLRALHFYRIPRPGIAEYEKEHATGVPNDRGDLNFKWVVAEGTENKQCRQNHNGDNNEHPQFFEKYKAGNALTLGGAVRDRAMFD